MTFAPNTHLSALLLLTTVLACGPKSEADGDDTDAGTSTGEPDSDSDPTAPTVSGATTTATTTATATATTNGSGEDTATATSGGGTSTSTTSTTSAGSATDTGEDTSDPPPVIPCEGEGAPLVGITTKIAYLESQVPPRPDTTTGGSSGTSGGGELDPGTLFVKLSDQAFTCAEPNASIPCGQHWQVTIVIPPEFQSPGTFNLLGQDVFGYAFETGAGAGDDCSFGGGSFPATFQILAIDEQNIEARLCNVEGLFFDTDPQLEGTFIAPRCP